MKHKFFITGFLIIIFVFLFIVIFGDRGLVHLNRLKTELHRIELKNQQLEKENARLSAIIARFRQDRDYVETWARRELGLVGENEVIFRFKDEDGSQKARGKTESDQEKAENDNKNLSEKSSSSDEE